MQDNRLTVTGAVVGLIGTALLLIEGIRAVAAHAILGTTSQLLMWLGLGVMAVAGVLLVLSAWQDTTDVSDAPLSEPE